MKIACKSCGIHWNDEFEKTLGKECNLWYSLGLSQLTDERKKQIWDIYFSIPIDEIAEECNVMIDISLRGTPVTKYENQWELIVPGYRDWPEHIRRKFQTDYFTWMKSNSSHYWVKLFNDLHRQNYAKIESDEQKQSSGSES